MKKFIAPVVILLVAGYAVYANLTAANTLVGVPEEFSGFIVGLIAVGVAWLLQAVLEATGWDFSGYKDQIVAVVSGIVLTLIESWLALIPSIYDEAVLVVLHLIVVVFGLLGFFYVMKRHTKVQAFQG